MVKFRCDEKQWFYWTYINLWPPILSINHNLSLCPKHKLLLTLTQTLEPKLHAWCTFLLQILCRTEHSSKQRPQISITYFFSNYIIYRFLLVHVCTEKVPQRVYWLSYGVLFSPTNLKILGHFLPSIKIWSSDADKSTPKVSFFKNNHWGKKMLFLFQLMLMNWKKISFKERKNRPRERHFFYTRPFGCGIFYFIGM